MDANRRRAILLGVGGLILLILGIRMLPGWLAAASQPPFPAYRPAVLFFNDTDPCECMQDLVVRADRQVADWEDGHPEEIQVVRFGMEARKDLEARYKVFRAPCLVLVDANDQIVWRQDYPLIEGGPFKLDELEQAISALSAE